MYIEKEKYLPISVVSLSFILYGVILSYYVLSMLLGAIEIKIQLQW